MVDMVTFQELHAHEDDTEAEAEEREYLDVKTSEAEQPPDENFLILLPATVQGFGFHDKSWRKS
jgi:hypothetical protein